MKLSLAKQVLAGNAAVEEIAIEVVADAETAGIYQSAKRSSREGDPGRFPPLILKSHWENANNTEQDALGESRLEGQNPGICQRRRGFQARIHLSSLRTTVHL